MRKYYSGITIFKLLGSLLVLLAHIKLPQVYLGLTARWWGLGQAMAIVIPCFYMVSGFLACQGWTHARRPGRYVRRYLTWLGGVYALFCCYYFATTTFPALLASYQAGHFSSAPLRMLFEIFLGRGPAPSLWFVPPLLFSIAVTYFFERRQRLALVCWLAVAGFLGAQFVAGTLRILVENTDFFSAWALSKHAPLLAYLTANYLGIGFPAVVAGAWVAHHEGRFQRLPVGKVALLGGLLLAAEIWLLAIAPRNTAQQLVLSMAPISLVLFYGVLHLQAPGIQAYHTLINRFSMVVFFLHLFLIEVNSWLFGWVPFSLSAGQAFACVLLTLPETLLLTLCLHHWRRRSVANTIAATPAAVSQLATAQE